MTSVVLHNFSNKVETLQCGIWQSVANPHFRSYLRWLSGNPYISAKLNHMLLGGLPWYPLPSPAIYLMFLLQTYLSTSSPISHTSINTGFTLPSSDATYFMTPSLISPIRIYSFFFSTAIASFMTSYQCFLPNYIISLWHDGFIYYLVPALVIYISQKYHKY